MLVLGVDFIYFFIYAKYLLNDPRTKSWWGVANPFLVIFIMTTYIYFCKYLGPGLMQHRKNFELKTVLIGYNLFQVCFSIFMVRQSLMYMLSNNFNLTCEPVDLSTTPRALQVAAGVWYYYIAKITELLDTVFFVLRKKYNQVSFLHLYHHTAMIFAGWFAVTYYPGGHLVFMGLLNSLVHVVMYTYYLISGFGPSYQKYLWWKKYLTIMQVIQFAMVFVHHYAALLSSCDFPKLINVWCCFNSLFFIYMFGNFYFQTYIKSPTRNLNKKTF